MKRFGYVLSGGGARGFAHLGVIKLLEELGIKPFAISGTSAGAIAGAFYAAGKNPEEILRLFKESNLFGWNSIAWKKEGIFSMEVLRKLMKESIGNIDFEDLDIKLIVAATDLIEAQTVFFSKGNLINAVVSSSSIPVVFEPVKLDNSYLVDGAILNNFPAEPLMDICDVIIGSSVNKIEKGIDNNSLTSTIDLLDRCFHLAISNSTYSKAKECDLFIEVPLYEYDVFDVKLADKIFDMGYKTALQHKDKLMELMESDIKTV